MTMLARQTIITQNSGAYDQSVGQADNQEL